VLDKVKSGADACTVCNVLDNHGLRADSCPVDDVLNKDGFAADSCTVSMRVWEKKPEFAGREERCLHGEIGERPPCCPGVLDDYIRGTS
jgi:hypothetical protein